MSVTSFARPSPSFSTTIVNAAVSPASIVPWSAVFRTDRSGQLIRMLTGPADGLPSFELVAEAVLLTTPQVAAVVGEEMCTVRLAPEARSPKSQLRTPDAIPQSAAPVPPSIVQLRPAFEGSVSVRVTSRATPAPLFVTVMR